MVLYTGEGPSLRVYEVSKNNNSYKIKSIYDGQLALSGSVCINHFKIDDKHIYFSNINKTHWIPATDEKIEMECNKFILTDAAGNKYERDIHGRQGFIVMTNNPLADFNVYDKNDKIIMDYETLIKQGYNINETVAS